VSPETQHREPAPLIAPGHTFGTVTDKISAVVLTRPTPRLWFVAFGVGMALNLLLLNAIVYLLLHGTGVWGVNIPVGWGFAIINFVWWIGIGHAGTLISAILMLLRQDWRQSINRFAEAMTLFAVACAGLYPILHLGRPWLAYWLFPYPNAMDMWPNFRSPLIWDVFAVTTYATVSLLFWFIGLIPDLATLRDRSTSRVGRAVYGMLAMGWRGSARHWQRYEQASLLLAALATPLVVSVHTIVSFDFAISIIPGWHATIFPRSSRAANDFWRISIPASSDCAPTCPCSDAFRSQCSAFLRDRVLASRCPSAYCAFASVGRAEASPA
jgi:molybdopterin-containing oxidoreductase family membrane subunit